MTLAVGMIAYLRLTRNERQLVIAISSADEPDVTVSELHPSEFFRGECVEAPVSLASCNLAATSSLDAGGGGGVLRRPRADRGVDAFRL